MVKPELGSKRQCEECGTKFFDLNKNPIVCPKCGATVQVAPVAVAGPRGRSAAKNDDEEPETEDAETVSLEDADADKADDGKVEAAATDDEEEEEDTSGNDDDDAFLEDDEEDDGDVSGLVDNDRDDDEER